jgi:two-component system chemotaxis response regulator CheB
VVLGASFGAVEALSVILPALPQGYALPLIVVVHQSREGEGLLPEVLGAKCRMKVKEAEDKEPILGDTVYVAPPDYHLLVEPDYRLSLSLDEPVMFSRPSIDVLFESAADTYGQGLTAVILSGANGDGARGLRIVWESGGTALVQRPELARAPVMPQAALEACPAARAMSLEGISAFIRALPLAGGRSDQMEKR